ncbi:MAG: ribonuclease P protein component [Magnetococcales bacterium]|nr:ribonuclease P protein component [Magnetococcales bacterium]
MPDSSEFGFPKSARLLVSGEFQRVMSRGRRIATRFFTLLTLPVQSAHMRLGITVSRKVGNAVQRTRVKRLIREQFRLHRPRLATGFDCVIIAKPQAGRTINAELHTDLHDLFTRLE